jgi:hypothetical protein
MTSGHPTLASAMPSKAGGEKRTSIAPTTMGDVGFESRNGPTKGL